MASSNYCLLLVFIIAGCIHTINTCKSLSPSATQSRAFTAAISSKIASMLNSPDAARMLANPHVTVIAPPKAQGKVELVTVNLQGLFGALKASKLCSAETNDGSVFRNDEGRLPKSSQEAGTYHGRPLPIPVQHLAVTYPS